MTHAVQIEVRGGVLLPALREDVILRTPDGLELVGELSLPLGREPVATIVALHPLPTAGGFMDSHIIRKAAARLPALADIAVLRFNFRGVSSPRGKSGGTFGEGITERFDLAAAMNFVRERSLPHPWLVGWSFGTEIALKYGLSHEIEGAILLSPPLHRTTETELGAWNDGGRTLIAVIPEFDDYLRPDAARARFALVPAAEVVVIEGGKHLWVGENQTRQVLDEIVRTLNPAALPLASSYLSDR